MDIQDSIGAKYSNPQTIYTRINPTPEEPLSKENLKRGLADLGIKLTNDGFEKFISAGIPESEAIGDDLNFNQFKMLLKPRGLGIDNRNYAFLRHGNFVDDNIEDIENENSEVAQQNYQRRVSMEFPRGKRVKAGSSESHVIHNLLQEDESVQAPTRKKSSPGKKHGAPRFYRDQLKTILNNNIHEHETKLVLSPKADIENILGKTAHKRVKEETEHTLSGCHVPGESATTKSLSTQQSFEERFTKVLRLNFSENNFQTPLTRSCNAGETPAMKDKNFVTQSITPLKIKENDKRPGGLSTKDFERISETQFSGRGNDASKIRQKYNKSEIFSNFLYP